MFNMEDAMKAAIVTAAGKTPIYGDFETPVAAEGDVLVRVHAAALSNVTKMRATGAHYSSAGIFPAIAGIDGVGITEDGRRVYFAMPQAPYGSLAEYCPIAERRLLEVPDGLDDVTAAAIANPGMSAWASLMERAKFVAGETVMVNGGTSTGGRIAIQLAKHLGAKRIIATGRNAQELEALKSIGADVVVPFSLGAGNGDGATAYEKALTPIFEEGIDVVIDYLWGESAKTAIVALAKTVDDHAVRFVHVGGASGEAEISLPGAALRSAAISLMGSGIGSVSREALVRSVRETFEAVGPAGLQIATKAVPLSEVESVWASSTGKPRVVFTMGE
jgi:NADPH:quinone reductase-like Zn-dependent oxidoreductase